MFTGIYVCTDIHVYLRYTSHAKGKASTAKQTCLGSFLGLELNLHCVKISSFWRHPCQLDLSRATRPQSSANDKKSRAQTTMRLVWAELALYLGCGCHLLLSEVQLTGKTA